MRRLRYLPSHRGAGAHAAGAVCLAASWSGERRHRDRRRRALAPDQGDGAGVGSVRRGDPVRAVRGCGHRARAVLDGGRQPDCQRPADQDRVRPRRDRPLSQRQPDQRSRAEGLPRPQGPHLSDKQRHRSGVASLRPFAGADPRGCDRRVGGPGPGRVFPGAADQGPSDCGARPLRVPAAGGRRAWRRDRRLLGDLRARSDRCRLRQGRRAGRGPGDRTRGGAVVSAVRGGAAVALRLRACVLRAPRQPRLRAERERRADQSRTAARPRIAGRCRCGGADSGLGDVRRRRVCRSLRGADEDGAHPEPLCRADLHRAPAGDPGVQGPGEAEPGEEPHRRQARGAGRRLDRAWHHQSQDRRDDPGGRRQ